MSAVCYRVPVAEGDAFTLSEVKAYLRVDHEDDDATITTLARASVQEIEHLGQLAFLRQTIRYHVFAYPGAKPLALPIGPALDDEAASVTVTLDGSSFADFTLEAGPRPLIRWGLSFADLVPERVLVEYQAGFGDTAADLPADLRAAVLDQCALHYDGRSPAEWKSAAAASSPHVARVAARYRGVRIA